MGMFGNAKDKISNAFSGVVKSVGKPAHERLGIEKVTTPLAQFAVAGGKGAYRMVMGSPFPQTFRKIRQDINRDSKVQVENMQDALVYQGNMCRIASPDVLKSSQVIKRDGVLHLQHGGKDYKLTLVQDQNDEKVGKGTSEKRLYSISGKKFEGSTNTVVYIDRDQELDTNNAEELIYFNLSNKIKAISFSVDDPVTAERSRPLSLLLLPFALGATALKLGGAIIKLPTDLLHGLLTNVSTKLINNYSQLQGLDGKDDAHGKMKAKINLGKALAVFAEVIKAVGVTADNSAHFLAAVTYSPSMLINSRQRQVSGTLLLNSGKELFGGFKQSAGEIINPVTISEKNPSGKFADIVKNAEEKKQPLEEKNIVSYDAKSNISLLEKQATNIGKVLKEAGLSDGGKMPISTDRAIYSALQNFSTSKGMAAGAA